MTQPKWYVAILVVQSRDEEAPLEHRLVDLQYRLIRATDPESAYARAHELGSSEGTSYRNAAHQEVTWEFVGLHDLHEVDDESLIDGTEVYSHLLEDDPRRLVRPKSKLEAFWYEANKHRTARDIIEGLEDE